MTPTVEPLAAPSATVLAAALLSTGVAGATSVTPMVKVCDWWSAAGGGLHGDAVGVSRRALEVELGGSATVTTPVLASMVKPPSDVGGQRVGQVGAVGSVGEGGDADRGADGGALNHGVGGVVAVDRRRNRSVR